MAVFVLNDTRFIYEEGKKNLPFEVTNNSDKTYGSQFWVDNTKQGDGGYMVPQPPSFKVVLVDIDYPYHEHGRESADRESLF